MVSRLWRTSLLFSASLYLAALTPPVTAKNSKNDLDIEVEIEEDVDEDNEFD